MFISEESEETTPTNKLKGGSYGSAAAPTLATTLLPSITATVKRRVKLPE
jgi:hypothetical protein